MELDWEYSGHGNLSMGNTDLESVREGMLDFFGKEDKLDKDGILRKIDNVSEEDEEQKRYSYVEGVRQQALMMFDWLGGNEKGFITKQDVLELTREQMRQTVLAFEGTDVSNTEEAEYGVIDVANIRDVIRELLVLDGLVLKDKFIRAYVEATQGTEVFAEIIFNKLRNETNVSDQVTKQEVQSNLRRAIQRFFDWGKEPEIPPGMESPEPNDAYMEDDKDDSDNDDESEETQDKVDIDDIHEEL